MQPKGPKASTKTHRRSRTGCFTCRLRRKKCDEGKPLCRACKHLGLNCDYKRPQWWGNVEQRKRQKENIKMMIKRTKITEKTVHLSPTSADSPPELSRSVPTSDTLSDTIHRERSQSLESGYSLDDPEVMIADPDHLFGHHHQQYAQQYPGAPYEFEIQTQKETYVNGYYQPPRRPSSTSSFGSIRRSSMSLPPTTVPESAYVHPVHPALSQQLPHQHSQPPQQAYYETAPEHYVDFNSYAPPHSEPPPPYIPADEADRPLIDHFVNNVQRLLLPILDLHGTARQDVILPALANNECYRHCCLSIAALHLKTTENLQGPEAEWVDHDITRHRVATISGLCEALAKDTDHLKILEATLGMILFQCSVGTPEDSLPDIPWHQHFQAASSLVNKLDLSRYLQPLAHAAQLTPSLNMTLTAWIDILGATMLGRAPQFADAYREKHLSSGLSGLRELMGCDDRVMYLISEIACLEALRDQAMLNDMDLCEHVKSLAMQIDLTEPPQDTILPPIVQSGHLDPRALTATMTAAFRYAARIYLCSLVPGFDRNQAQVKQLLDKLTNCLDQIPAGVHGFDRSLVWVYLIGGSVASADSSFRGFFGQRCADLGEHAAFGSFGRMGRLLNEVWALQDAGNNCHWRDVMRSHNWDSLLI
ncbi:fungal-specific transcription factor domain-containing protein [Geopyxis carbonaria]|nr:fungal-specific transcription factor domain-containing protein [Geopyxis carbonaria]